MRTDHNRTFSKPIREELEKRGVDCFDPEAVIRVLEEPLNRKLLELLRIGIHREDSISWASLLKLASGVGPTFHEWVYSRARQVGATFAQELLVAYDSGFSEAPSSAKRVKCIMKPVLKWLGEIEIPAEQPEGGWGRWIIEHVGDGVLPEPTEEFRALLLELDALAEEAQPLVRYLSQIEPLGKDLALSRGAAVRLMTMGGSKGLTVRATVIAGVEEGVIPRPNCDLSEERRILYVAMTRAKEYTLCTWAQRRRGPTARAGHSSGNRRRFCHFLEGGPVSSVDGVEYLNYRFR